MTICAASSALLVNLIATARGIGLQEDSAIYIGAARSLIAGHGLTVPFGTTRPELLTQYPPLYALLLAAHRVTGRGVFEFARWINVGFAVLLVVVVVRASRLITSGSLGAAVLAALVVVMSTRMIAVTAMVMSEPAMIGLGTLGLYLLARFLQQGNRRILLVAGGLAGLAGLTRYVGIAYALTGLAILINESRRRRCRLRMAALYGLVGLAPLALFLAYSSLATDTPTNRPLGLHPPPLRDVRSLIDTFGSWFGADVGWATTLIAFVVIGLTLLAVAQLLRRQSRDHDGHPLTSLLVTFAVVYVMVVLIAITFADASIPGDAPRILLPVLPIVAVLLPAGLGAGVRDTGLAPAARSSLPVLLAVALVVPLMTNSIRWMNSVRVSGAGVTMEKWEKAPLVARVSRTPRDVRIYSNDAPLLYLLTNREVIVDVPSDYSVYTRHPNRGFSNALARMEREVRTGKAEVVFFDNGFSPSQARLSELVDLTPIFRSGSATIFVGAGWAVDVTSAPEGVASLKAGGAAPE